LGTLQAIEAEVEYTALVSVKVDLESGEVVSVGIRATRDEDEPAGEVSVTLESGDSGGRSGGVTSPMREVQSVKRCTQ